MHATIQPQRARQTVGQTLKQEPANLLKQSLSMYLDSAGPIPEQVTVGGTNVTILDVVSSMVAFRQQFTIMQQQNSVWPSVILDFSSIDPTLGRKSVPLDLRASNNIGTLLKAIIDGKAQEDAATYAEEAGFSVNSQTPLAAKLTFLETLSAFLKRRLLIAQDDLGEEPPSALFVVDTEEPGMEVLFATGYFINTKQGFDFSTPAVRMLFWGVYTFGLNVSGVPRFCDTLWSVPDTSHIQLKL